jgi:hypothetical protein
LSALPAYITTEVGLRGEGQPQRYLSYFVGSAGNLGKRMFRYKTLVIWLLICMALPLSAFHAASRSSIATGIQDTPETREIMVIMEKAYELLAIPFDTLDVNQLSEVFRNDPSYADHLSFAELDELKEYTHKIQGEAALKDFGYLTTMRTKRMNQQHGARLLRGAREKAKAENREVSKEEMRQLTEQNFGMEPYLPDQNEQGKRVPFKRILRYFSLKIEGETAEVCFDDMAKTRRATLMRVNGRWYVTGIF